MEVKYGHMFDSKLYQHTTRVAARGNATSFALPWEELLQRFQDVEENEHKKQVHLPRTPAELTPLVKVLLKTSDVESPADVAQFLHQATVRRDVVVQFIMRFKKLGHKAYVNVHEADVHVFVDE